ncbi:hypothetical protein UFOVP84_99 [uncultured Caudovirales phage]|uniref:Uncharacterized protein n=1 Tax=uncultured Caudovirales phage TaxID=2100421 RepID=A0A6J5L103_9CAUD|nr:hypothetical protein UFOVP84_99 [uncultured Caudovirales phage]
MIKLKETTVWDVPNHTYILTDDKQSMLGYIIEGTTEVIMFKKSMRFDRRRRTFKEVK